MDYPGKVITKNQVTPTQTSASGNWTLDDAAAAIKNNNWPVAGVPNPISKSLRFNSADTAYLNRTPASASNRKTWTWSGWIKRSSAKYSLLFAAGNTNDIWNSGSTTQIGWAANTDSISVYDNGTYFRTTTQVFRDFSAWGHLVVAVDTTQATAANRVKMYWNGVEITAFSTSNNPTQNADTFVNAAHNHVIGGQQTNVANSYYDGYVTEVNFIDGQALTPSSFGMTNPQTGQWIPIKYSGTYGTNGFYLNFKDATSTTTLGYDYSGNANNWTTNNFSVTAGSGNDSLTDVPTPWVAYNTTGDVGGVIRGNYATLNPLIIVPAGTISNGNLDYNRGSTASHGSAAASFTLPTTGKWYWEVTACKSANNETIGIANIQNNPQLPATGSEIGTGSRGDYGYRSDGNKYNNGSQGAYGATYTSGDVIGVAWDSDAGTLVFYKNGSSQGTAFSSITQVVGKFAPAVSSAETSPDVFNFGQRPFAYTPPAGFLSLCSTNLPTPTIGFGLTNQGDDYFNISLYTGNGTNQSITGLGFQPDFIWFKSRNTVANHALIDAVRGRNKLLFSSLTDAEATSTTTAKDLVSFDADGFTVGVPEQSGSINTNGTTNVAWNWKANGAGSSNTAGSITSTVSANTTAGFSIVTYTGNGSTGATVGHGLGVAPKMLIVKNRSISDNWAVYHSALGATKGINLNLTSAAFTWNRYWNDTAPTSTVFTVGGSVVDPQVNGNGNSIVAYCFAAVAGYSAFGSYTGNGSTDGPFVYTGFRPRFVMVKYSSSTGDWMMNDTARDTYNVVSNDLKANVSNAEVSFAAMDITSNSFKIRTTDAEWNQSGGTYIYIAIAESPFKFANAR